VDVDMLVYEVADYLEVVGLKYGSVVEVLAASVNYWFGKGSIYVLTVMRRVFVGGEGVIRGGRSERSIESGVLDEPRLLDIVECGGVCVSRAGNAGGVDMMAVVIY
jgi:hypothetical protein